MKEATENTEIKDLYFTSPVTFASMQRPPKYYKTEEDKQKGKGKSKKGKGKGKGGKRRFLPGTKLESVTHTPDGKQICYRYNMKGKKCDGKCGRVHVYRVRNCNADHPAFDHPTSGGN